MVIVPWDPRIARLLLHRRVLERGGWRCQICGSSENLQVHHLKFRSMLGDDELSNLISLCVRCHRQQHGSSRTCRGIAKKLKEMFTKFGLRGSSIVFVVQVQKPAAHIRNWELA